MPFDGTQNHRIQLIDAMEAQFKGGSRWIKGRLADSEGGRCLVGAMRQACGMDLHADETWRPLDDEFDRLYRFFQMAILGWHQRQGHQHPFSARLLDVSGFNDNPNRTYADIEATLQLARELAMEKTNAV